jgi:hypothetical protein
MRFESFSGLTGSPAWHLGSGRTDRKNGTRRAPGVTPFMFDSLEFLARRPYCPAESRNSGGRIAVRKGEKDFVTVAGWSVLASWAVGFSASVSSAGSGILAAAMAAAAGIAILLPKVWNRLEVALVGTAALVLPWLLNTHTVSEHAATAMGLTLLVVLAGISTLVIRRPRRAGLRRRD